MSDGSQYQNKGLEKTPEVTPEKTKCMTPVNVGHLSGDEVNQLGLGSDDEEST